MNSEPATRSRRQEDAATTASAHTTGDGFKETSESIVVAFILAFVFRTFIIEAFVIPTGSMAATLYGNHGAIVCEDCGWENVYGLTDTSTRKGRYGPGSRVLCQNCNHVNAGLSIHDGEGAGTRASRYGNSNAEAGDRILVFKWPLDFGSDLLGPKRWDVTVFKNPAKADENFIKRLVGLPNEVLEIIDGDVYTADVTELSDRAVAALDVTRRIKFKQRSGQSVTRDEFNQLRSGAPKWLLDELAEKLHIRSKTPDAQQSLWQVVYDHDYPPREPDSDQPRWTPATPRVGDGWSSANRRLGITGGQADIRFTGKRIVDQCAYNMNVDPTEWNNVSDVRLETVLHPKGGDGHIEFTIAKPDTEFHLRLHADGRTTLSRTAPRTDGQTLAETIIPAFEVGRPMDIVFQIVDYRASAIIDGDEILATTPEQFAPDIAALRQPRHRIARPPYISAIDIELDLLHVVLFRDGYYTSPTFGRTKIASWAGRGWGTAGNPILMREDEYFMLGDNSPASKDSRLWDTPGTHLVNRGEDFQLGTVPKDQLVGRAFFVYWPSGLRPDWLPVLGEHGIIPNVGRMRWIR